MERLHKVGRGIRVASALLLSISVLTCRMGVDEPEDSDNPGSGIPVPAHGAKEVAVNPTLSWDLPDTQGKSGIRHDIYLSTANPPATVLVRDYANTSYPVSHLSPGSTYYWRVDYLDGSTLVTGPVWRFTVTTDVNRKPVFTGLVDTSVNTGQSLRFILSAPDPDGDSVAYSMQGPSGAALTGKVFAWTPAANQNGNHQIRFIARDNGSPPLSDTALIAVSVVKVNRPPVLEQPRDTAVNEGQQLRLALSASDPDSGALAYSMRNAPSGAALAGNIFTWTPDTNQAGTYLIDFVVMDRSADSLRDAKTARITVRDMSAATGLVAYWDFNEGSGATLTDRSGNGNHGVVVGGIWASGIDGGGLEIRPGSDGHVRIPYHASLDLGDRYSVSSWTRMRSDSLYLAIITSGTASPNNWDFYLLASQTIHFATWTNTGTYRLNGPRVVKEAWTQITAVKTPDSSFIYINGVRTSQMASSGVMSLADDFYLGKFADGSGYRFDGVMDEIRIHNRPLTPAEIAAEWDIHKHKIMPGEGLVAYWPFSGNANDASGNGNDGTVSGATLTADRFGNANSAYRFDGMAEYLAVNHASSLNLTSAFSLSAWIKPQTDTTSISQIMDKSSHANNSAYSFYLNEGNANRLRCVYYQAGSWMAIDDTVANLYDGAWHHVVFSVKNGEQRIYIDGGLSRTEERVMTGTNTNTGVLTIGNGTARSFHYKGELDDLRLFNRALTPSEVQALEKEGR